MPHRYNYETLEPLNHNKPENFFVGYAVRGNINKETASRNDMPYLYPLKNSPVYQPSPLNTRYKYIPEVSTVGIL